MKGLWEGYGLAYLSPNGGCCYTLLVWCSMQGIWVHTQQKQEGIVVSMIISANEYLI